ncbi:MAG TPA: hypothetical protein DCR64_12250, partial [Vibrio sp.]|nr:hypothetical protein [Vibrio sp.]
VYLTEFEYATVDSGIQDSNDEYEVTANETQTEEAEPILTLESENSRVIVNIGFDDQTLLDIDIDSQENEQDIAQPTSTKQPTFKTVIGDKHAGPSFLKASLLSADDNMVLVNSSGLIKELKNLEDEVQLTLTMESILMGGGVAVSTGLSVGYVAWLLRSGIILTSVLSSMPAWRFIDPLPILSSLTSVSEDEETLESIVTGNDDNSNEEKGE